MKLYIGTLHTIENEFNDCLSAIRRQTHTNFEHFIFSGLDNKEAHATLFKDFLSKKNEFDILIKVDADMVIANDHLFEDIEACFKDTNISILTVAVHDWFSNRSICGLASYRNNIQWCGDHGGVFVDNVTNKGQSIFDWDKLAPAAYHSPNPSPFQAFHFGLHKAMKVIQNHESDRIHWRMREHWDNILKAEIHFKHSRDRRLALAILASELVYSGYFKPEHISYNHPFPARVFAKYKGMETDDILFEIKQLRIHNWGWLPAYMRQALLWYKFRPKHFSGYAIKTLIMDLLRPR